MDSFVTCFIYSHTPPFLTYLLVQDWFSESILIAVHCFIIWIQFISFLYYWWKFLVIFLYSKPQCNEWVYVFPCTNSQQFFWVYSYKWNQQDMEYAYLPFFFFYVLPSFSAIYTQQCIRLLVSPTLLWMSLKFLLLRWVWMFTYCWLQLLFFFLKSP